MRPLLLSACLLLIVQPPARAADPQDPLARARALYNQRNFGEAIEAAEDARRVPARADSADLIAARGYLERFRESGAPEDLSGARERLRRINADRLSSTERSELLVGLGEELFFDDSVGAAASVFDSLLIDPRDLTYPGDPGNPRDSSDSSASMDSKLPRDPRGAKGDPREPTLLGPGARERVLDWWASALDRQARPRPDIERQSVYQRIRDRMRVELGRNPGSAAASYWLAAAALGQGDVQAAWDAALAGWVRGPLAPDLGAALRGDLDLLVERAIVPERSKTLALPPETVLAEWEAFKEKWSK
jgi:hypothetical protein